MTTTHHAAREVALHSIALVADGDRVASDEVLAPGAVDHEAHAVHGADGADGAVRVQDGQVVEHWATRDDLGQGVQLGGVPPIPLHLLRCARAERRIVRQLS